MNWYKNAQNSKSVEDIARDVRASLLTDDEDSLKSLCLPVSRHLAQVLINEGYAAANVVQGVFTVDTPDEEAYADWDVQDFMSNSVNDDDDAMESAYESMESAKYTPLHYWVQINDIVVDITADQFNDELEDPVPEVIVASINNLDRYTVMSENFIEPKIMYKWAM